MAAYQKGDVQAFADLVARHEKRLWNFVRRFVCDSTTAEDLLQEVFLRVVRGAADWHPTAKVSTWLYTIARNLCTDQARRAEHRRAESLDDPALSESGERMAPRVERLPSPAASSEAQVIDRETASQVDRALAELPVEQREVFLMRETMEMSFAEIAQAVGASEPTVKSRMRYALQRLRSALMDLREGGAALSRSVGETP